MLSREIPLTKLLKGVSRPLISNFQSLSTKFFSILKPKTQSFKYSPTASFKFSTTSVSPTSMILDEENKFIFNISRYLSAGKLINDNQSQYIDRFIILRQNLSEQNKSQSRTKLSLPDRNASVQLTPHKRIFDLIKEFTSKRRGANAITSIQFRSYDNIEMCETTPVSLLLTLPYFILKVNQHTHYAVLNQSNFALNNQKHRVEVQELPLYSKSISDYGMRSSNARILSEITTTLLQGFKNKAKDHSGKFQLTDDGLTVVLKQALVARARQLRLETNYLYQHLIRLEKQQRDLSSAHKLLQSKAQQHAVRRARQFVSIFLIQFLLTQYGTYVMFSWDIMEPITCVMTLGDAVIGYLFWMWTKKGYEANSVHKFFFQRKMKKLIKKSKFDLERYNMVKDSISIIKKRLQEIS